MKIIERIFDETTEEVTEIERELSKNEILEIEATQKLMKAKAAENSEKLEAKAILLAKLGITEEEAKLLLS